MAIAGIDFSSRFIDVVLLDEDTDAAEWHRFELSGADAFDRARDVRQSFKPSSGILFEDCLAIGIEQPQARGPRAANMGSLYRIQGAILTCLPPRTLVHPLWPSVWRKTVGLPGNADKMAVAGWAIARWPGAPVPGAITFDATDAYTIAYATRTLLRTEAA